MLCNHYKILEISVTATDAEIKKAFRSKAKLVHPDVNKSPEANELFIRINEAYETLLDKHKRHLFDLQLKYPHRAPHQTRSNNNRNKKYPKPNPNFHYNWDSFKKAKEETAFDRLFAITPLIHNLLFGFGMFIGFLLIISTIGGIIVKGWWPKIFLLLIIPGMILVKEGWNGIIGKASVIKKMSKGRKNIFP